MLENLDLKVRLEKDEYKARMKALSDRLFALQKATWKAGIPVIILFEGWDAAGKGTAISRLTAPLDPRGYRISPIRAARTYEKKRPWLWRFWLKIPARGEWAIFDRSWYGRVLVERIEKLAPKKAWKRAYRDIVDFERALSDDGALLIKFFLHIAKKEQRKRFKRLEKDPLNAWRVAPEDWKHHKQYKQWLNAYEEMLEATETEWGPWTVVEATDKRHTRVKIYETIIAALEKRLTEAGIELPQQDVEAQPAPAQEQAGSESAEVEHSTPPAQSPETPEQAVVQAPANISPGNAGAPAAGIASDNGEVSDADTSG